MTQIKVHGALADGLYQVTNAHICASFCVKDGVVVMIAPILRKNFWYFASQATLVKE